MSTQDCKDLLVERFPDTQAKAWKRVSKFNNIHDEEIRAFDHPQVGRVWVNEEEGEISTDAACILNAQASALKPSDFYVAFEPNPSNDGIFGGNSMMVVYKPFFDSEGCFDSIHLEHIMTRLFPRGVPCNEDCEATFGFHGDARTLDELKDAFRKAGFIFSQAVQDYYEQ